jgi:hypothetical protein
LPESLSEIPSSEIPRIGDSGPGGLISRPQRETGLLTSQNKVSLQFVGNFSSASEICVTRTWGCSSVEAPSTRKEGEKKKGRRKKEVSKTSFHSKLLILCALSFFICEMEITAAPPSQCSTEL